MFDACAEAELLSTMIPLVAPELFAGKDAALLTFIGGHVGFPVTLIEMTQPVLLVRHALPEGMGAPLAALLPTLQKIQAVEVPALLNSVTGEHVTSMLSVARPVSGVEPTPLRTPVGVKLN